MSVNNIPTHTIDHETNGNLQKLDHQLCFALYVCSKEVIKHYKQFLDPFNLTYTSYITLLALWEEDHINVKDLGKKLYLDSGTLTPILKKLEAGGLLQRNRSESDERNVYIILTQDGIDLKEKLSHIPKQMICNLPIEEQAELKPADLLKSLHQLMNIL